MPETILISHNFLPDGQLARWRAAFPEHAFVDQPCVEATVGFGLPADVAGLSNLKWIQLASAGVPASLCPIATERQIRVTNLAGLYGPTIAEHALAMMLILSRNLHVVQRNQAAKSWNRDVANGMRDLAGSTLGVFGLGNIGQNIARLGKAMGMRVVGCRRHAQATPYVDQVFDCAQKNTMAAEADVLAVAAPLTRETDGCLGDDFFAALKPGAIVVNVSRGPIVNETALLKALDSGHVAGAGLDVFAVEPLPTEHPFWHHPKVIVSPHYSGETVNLSTPPAERFTRNLRNWLAGRDLEGVVKLELGY